MAEVNVGQPYEEIVVFLKEGERSAQELDSYLKTLLPEKTDEQIYLYRINCIGWFRTLGFQIPRKRGFYQITGFKTPEEFQTADQWPAEQQEVFEWFDSLPKVTEKQYYDLRDTALKLQRKSGSAAAHQLSAGYTLSYELANDEGRYYQPLDIVIVRKFQYQPRFRILFPPAESLESPQPLVEITEKLGKVSRRPVRLMSTSTAMNFKSIGYEWIGSRVQGLYSLDSFLDVDKFLKNLSPRKRSYVRRNLAELTMVSLDKMSDDQWLTDAKKVVDLWRAGPAGQKQRQLAITRDYVAIDLAPKHIRETSFLFYRGDNPVGVVVYDPITFNSLGDLVCKGLNYPSLPGGYHNTALAMIQMMAHPLNKLGFHFLNDGGLDGGTSGLYEYKASLIESAEGSITLTTKDWAFPGALYTPEKVPAKTQGGSEDDVS